MTQWWIWLALFLFFLFLVLSIILWITCRDSSNTIEQTTNHTTADGRSIQTHICPATVKQSICPTNVFNRTSKDLWPCQALQNLAAIGIGRHQIDEIYQSLSSTSAAVFPWSPGYNTLRLNVDLQQQRLPLLVVVVQCETDIQTTLALAHRYKQKVSIRNGGHCNESFSIYHPFVLLLGPKFSWTQVNEKQRRLICSGGATQGRLFEALSKVENTSFGFPLAHRRHAEFQDEALNTGNASDVGVSGVVSVGGVGFLQRKLGLTIDSVVSIRIALADGQVVTATASNAYSDLFMAVRGSGGGNYGVITRIEFALHDIPTLTVFTIHWADWSQAALVFDTWQTLAPFYPDELTVQLYFVIAPGATIPSVSSSGVFVGTDRSLLETLLAPLLAIPSASVTYQETTFAGQATKFASGRTYFPFGYRRTLFAFAPLSPAGIATLIGQTEAVVGIPGSHTLEFDPFGGQVAARPLNSSAFYPRQAQFWLLFSTVWPDQADSTANMGWTTDIFTAMQPYVSPHSYTGFVMLDQSDFLDRYYGTLLPTLRTIKTKYDPTNFFSFPQSIPPL